MNESYVMVPESWLRRLDALATKVTKQMDEGPAADYNVYIKTEISALVGYAASSRTLLRTGARREVLR